MIAVGKEDHQELASGIKGSLDQEGLCPVWMPVVMKDPIDKDKASLQAKQIDQNEIPVFQEPPELSFIHKMPASACLLQISGGTPPGIKLRLGSEIFVLYLFFPDITLFPAFLVFSK